MTATISPHELQERATATTPITLIDVRTPAEYWELHVEGALNIPLDQLTPQAVAAVATSPEVYFICQKGGRGQMACDKMVAAGVANPINVGGGTLACEQSGLPLIRGAKTISLERQVRIAAGSLVVLGTAGGYFFHPLGFALAAFVGAGLVFAGVTDTCGMGMLLAKMPWNQAKPPGTNCRIG